MFALGFSACVGSRHAESDQGRAAPPGATSSPAADAGATGGGPETSACAPSGSGLKLVGPPASLLDLPPDGGTLYTALLWTGMEHLIIWRVHGSDGIFMRRLDGLGQSLGDDVRLRGYEYAFDAAWGAGRIGAAWTEEGTAGQRSIVFQPFDAQGTALGEPLTIRASPDINLDGGVMYGPRIVATGPDFAIVWGEKGSVLLAKVAVDATGAVASQPVLVADNDLAPYVNIASGNGSVLVGWTRGLATPPLFAIPKMGMTMLARAFSPALTPMGDAVTVGEDPSFIDFHQLLVTNTGFVALWGSGFPPDTRVQVARLNANASLVESHMVAQPAVGRFRYPAPSAWSGDQLVLLWNRDGDGETGLTLSRFNAMTGERKGPSLEVPTGMGTARLYLAEHGGHFAFTWSEQDDSGYRLFFQRAELCQHH